MVKYVWPQKSECSVSWSICAVNRNAAQLVWWWGECLPTRLAAPVDMPPKRKIHLFPRSFLAQVAPPPPRVFPQTRISHAPPPQPLPLPVARGMQLLRHLDDLPMSFNYKQISFLYLKEMPSKPGHSFLECVV
jgi:hypothetical protein